MTLVPAVTSGQDVLAVYTAVLLLAMPERAIQLLVNSSLNVELDQLPDARITSCTNCCSCLEPVS